MGRVGGGEMQEGREMGTYCICVADSLCCRAEANTLLRGNYTSIKMFEKKINKKIKALVTHDRRKIIY